MIYDEWYSLMSLALFVVNGLCWTFLTGWVRWQQKWNQSGNSGGRWKVLHDGVCPAAFQRISSKVSCVLVLPEWFNAFTIIKDHSFHAYCARVRFCFKFSQRPQGLFTPRGETGWVEQICMCVCARICFKTLLIYFWLC